jgi:hypothetical protein
MSQHFLSESALSQQSAESALSLFRLPPAISRSRQSMLRVRRRARACRCAGMQWIRPVVFDLNLGSLSTGCRNFQNETTVTVTDTVTYARPEHLRPGRLSSRSHNIIKSRTFIKTKPMRDGKLLCRGFRQARPLTLSITVMLKPLYAIISHYMPLLTGSCHIMPYNDM